MLRHLTFAVAIAIGTLGGQCFGHTGAGHYREFSIVFNGYGDEGFQELCRCVSSGVDHDLPEAFRKAVGSVPGNHRVLGHGWTLDAAIPKETLQHLETTFPGKREAIVEVWSQHANRVKELARAITGLAPAQADAFAAILHDIHLLGDMEPGNVITKYVLPPREVAKHLIEKIRVLFRNQPEYAYAIENELKRVMRLKLPPKMMSEAMIDSLARCKMGEKLHRAHPGMKIQFSNKYVRSAEAKYASRILERAPGVKDDPQIKAKEKRLAKSDFAEPKGLKADKAARRLVPGLLSVDGRLMVALKGGASAGIMVFAMDGGLATYSYMKGDVNVPEYHEKLADAAIKGASVGGAVAVSVMLGAGPAGWVVLGVSIGAYEVSDFVVSEWRENQRRKFLTFEDLEPFGITPETTLELEDESLFMF